MVPGRQRWKNVDVRPAGGVWRLAVNGWPQPTRVLAQTVTRYMCPGARPLSWQLVSRASSMSTTDDSDRESPIATASTSSPVLVARAYYYTTSVRRLFFNVNLNQPVSHPSTSVPEENLWKLVKWFATGWVYFLLRNQQCQNAEENTKHWPKPVAWPHLFFIHHPTSEERWRFSLHDASTQATED